MRTISYNYLGVKIEIEENLDDVIDPKDLTERKNEFNKVAEIFKNLVSYCEAKENAIQCRLGGKIELALRFEKAADRVYERLPEWCKW